MRVFLTCPTLRPHGGVRVLLEWANRLPDVTVRVPRLEPLDWMTVAPHVRLVTDDSDLRHCDTLIVGSPHAIGYLDHEHRPDRRFVFLQMLEDMFRPRDLDWRAQCVATYTADAPLITISRWNKRVIRHQHSRKGPMRYVGNGVSLDDFPIENAEKPGNVVLVEGWNAGNPTKDIDRIGPQVAKRLKAEGFRIVGYAAKAPRDYRDVPDEFHVQPDLQTLNRLYREATILIKATMYDARATAPMEAMTKGTPTVRAIIEGDDDLTAHNSVRVGYHVDSLYQAAHCLLSDQGRLEALSHACIDYARAHSWDRVWPEIEEVLT